MARARMITRTVKVTTVEVMGVYVEKAEVTTFNVTLYGEFKTNLEIQKLITKEYETEGMKVVNTKVVETVEKLYGMSEEDFVYNAKELPPRDTK